MERTVFICVPGRHALSYASLGSRGFGGASFRKLSVQRNVLRSQFVERSFHQDQTFFKNELLEFVDALGSTKNGLAIVFPAVWAMGGGPRTYPGGVRKWQWKRRERKDKRKLEKERLTRERKICASRRREELRKTPVPLTSVSANSFNSLESSDGMLSSSLGGANLLSPRTLLAEAAVSGSTTLVRALGKAGEERQASGAVQGGWTGSRTEVAVQIERVRNILINKHKQLAGLRGDGQTSTSSFSNLPLSPSTLKALTFILDVRNMTPLQEATLPIVLQGGDIFARTKVAGEDTIASLIYAIELVLKRRQAELPLTAIARLQENLTVSGRLPITALLVCPTHESASLIASEAKLLLMFHSGIRVQVVKGGNDMRKECQSLQRLPCQIVVATPGRLLNHILSSPELRGQLGDLRLFALMEVQKLLDMGYRRTIERIAHMISRSRQTIMWSSAAKSDEALALAETLLKKKYQLLSLCEDEEDDGPQQMVRHDVLIAPMESHLALIFSLINAHVERETNYKIVVFCQTVRTTTFMAEAFKNLGFFTCELHMRKNENQRERDSALFRTMNDGVILFTCGASVWGVANPDVTLILQVGQPAGREQYVRRVTLSGQETKERKCILLLLSHEQAFLKELSGVPLCDLASPQLDSDTEAKVQDAVQQVDSLFRVKAYIAWLRYHVAKATSTADKLEALRLAGIYCTVLGFNRAPLLTPRTIKALGLKGIIDIDPQEGEGKR